MPSAMHSLGIQKFIALLLENARDQKPSLTLTDTQIAKVKMKIYVLYCN